MKEKPQQNQEAAFRHLGAIFFRRVEELGERPFIKLQRGDRFEEISWRDFGTKVRATILGLYSLGVRKGERVAVLADNRVEWLCADAATLAGGLPNVVLSPRLSDPTTLRILGHSGSRVVFVEDEIGLGRILNLKGQLPALAYIIVMDQTDFHPTDTITFDGLLSRGRMVGAERIKEILESVQPDDLASIIYTSGSTGEPKGVMRTHGNILSNIKGGTEILPSKPEELFVIVLSLNHLLGRFGFHKSMANGRTTAIVEATELEVDLATIRSLSPTAMTLVPRVMERIWGAILADGKNRDKWETIEAMEREKASCGSPTSDEVQQYETLRGSLKESVKRALGGRIKYISYAGAPMAPRIMHFFDVIRIPLLGSYGLTECGGVTLSELGEYRQGSLGKPFPNVELRIADDGEILVRGPSVMPGYFENPKLTREVLDPDGWFHTGDLGTIDSDGSLRVVGRKKDVFYCSDGSNIYPAQIELQLENDSFIRQAVLLGDHRPFISALVVPDRSRISADLKREESSLADGELERILWERVERINEGLEHYEKIRKVVVLHQDFPEKVRSVTAFQKIKIDRKAVTDMFQKEIEEIYRADR
ncbi:MAG: AMP-dependent synthetase/ligase [Candidatus Binatia bacterium]